MEAENVSDSVGLNAAEGAETDAYKRDVCKSFFCKIMEIFSIASNSILQEMASWPPVKKSQK